MTNLNITINCGICIIQDINTEADHRCETCGFDVCENCAGAGYDLDHARIDQRNVEIDESMTEFEKNWLATEETATEETATEEFGWEMGTCRRGHGVKIHGARVSFKVENGKKVTGMFLPFCAQDTRVSMVFERDVKPAGVREINCKTSMKIGASWPGEGAPFTG